MQVFHTVSGLRAALDQLRRQGKRIACVPTMGNLHEGHLQLVKLAHQHADVVVATIFVNPLQFGLNEDWEKYPRTIEDDIKKLESVECHFLFNPTESEIYPNGMAEQTRVIVPTMTDILCGASRPTHFEGVTTVVSKLLHIVKPDAAVFGLKDYQQLAVIRRMVEDLCIDVELIPAPIARADDGLALSSRNSYLSPKERKTSVVLFHTLSWVAEQIANGSREFIQLELDARQRIAEAGYRPDYVSICNSQTLDPAAIDDQTITVLGAMYASNARLIDNISLNLGEAS